MKTTACWILFLAAALLFVPGQAAFCQSSENESLKRLQDRIQALEDEIDYYRQEMEARQALMPKEEEAQDKQKTEDVLKASEEESAKYVLLKERTIEMRYGLSYSHSTYDKLVATAMDVERESYNNFVNTLNFSYGLMERISLSSTVPFVYKYQESGGSNLKEADLGDISVGVSWQAFKEAIYRPAILFSLAYSAPTGKSPYRINPASELSTGSGTHEFSLGMNLSKVLDPVIAFGGFSFSYPLEVTGLDQKHQGAILTSVKPGYTIGYALGIGFALSYNTSVSFRFSASHTARTDYILDGKTYESDASSSASFVIGTGWRVTPKTNLNVALGYGLVGVQNYSLSFSIPFSFTL